MKETTSFTRLPLRKNRCCNKHQVNAIKLFSHIFIPMKKITYLLAIILFVNQISIAQINIATGGGGSITGIAQSYNENRAAEVVVLSATNITVQSITLSGFFCGNNGGTDSAYLGARIYNAATGALVALANDSVHNIFNTNVTIPISYTLISGSTYRISVNAWGPHPPTGNSGLMYYPATLPYTEPTGMLQINHGYDIYTDSMPNVNNIYIPLITLNTLPTGIAQINEANTFSFYPNPFSDQATLKFNNPNKIKFSFYIYNAQGQLVETTGNIFSDAITINRKNLNKGLYFFQLLNEKSEIISGRFAVE